LKRDGKRKLAGDTRSLPDFHIIIAAEIDRSEELGMALNSKPQLAASIQ